jgi:hypothetical protein
MDTTLQVHNISMGATSGRFSAALLFSSSLLKKKHQLRVELDMDISTGTGRIRTRKLESALGIMMVWIAWCGNTRMG